MFYLRRKINFFENETSSTDFVLNILTSADVSRINKNKYTQTMRIYKRNVNDT